MKIERNFIAATALFVLALALASCGITPGDAAPVAPQAVTTATPTATGTAPLPTLQAAEPVAETREAASVGADANPHLIYANAAYGFSLCHPATWTATDVNDADFIAPGSRSVQLSKGTAKLVIGYRRAGEDTPILGSGGPAGELQTGDALSMIGQEVHLHRVVLDDRVQVVFYGAPGTVLSTGDIEFAPRLDDFAQSEIDLSSQVQAEAEMILRSLTLGSDTATCTRL